MLNLNRLPIKIFVAIAIGYLLTNVILVLKNTIINYPPKDGFILTNGRVIGGDFIAFYTAGKIARFDLSNLYDFRTQKETRKNILKHAADSFQGELPFVYPPLVAWIFSWFTFFNFDTAFYLWVTLSIVISLFSLLILSYYLGIFTIKSSVFILLGVFGFIPYFIDCLAGGQLATIGILIYSLLFFLLQEKKDFIAGLVLSLGYYKPPLFFFFAIVVIMFRGKQFFFGCLTGGIILTALSISYTGFLGFEKYLSIVSRYTYGQELMKGVMLPPESGMGIFALTTTLSSLMITSITLYMVCFVILLYVCAKLFKLSNSDKKMFEITYAYVVISSLALSLQLIKYDLSILLAPFLILVAKYEILNKYKVVIGMLIFSFYCEWIFREIVLVGLVLNVSSFLFILILIFLFLSLRSYHKNILLKNSQFRLL